MDEEHNEAQKGSSKNFIGIMFNCCNVYARIYKNKEGTAYVGRCPKCMRPVRLLIGEGGVHSRFFSAQ